MQKEGKERSNEEKNLQNSLKCGNSHFLTFHCIAPPAPGVVHLCG